MLTPNHDKDQPQQNRPGFCRLAEHSGAWTMTLNGPVFPKIVRLNRNPSDEEINEIVRLVLEFQALDRDLSELQGTKHTIGVIRRRLQSLKFLGPILANIQEYIVDIPRQTLMERLNKVKEALSGLGVLSIAMSLPDRHTSEWPMPQQHAEKKG